jgi:hypothetical protein
MSLWQSVHDSFEKKNISGAVVLLERFVETHSADRFSCLPSMHFENPQDEVLGEINRFIEANQSNFNVEAIYIEMNGFDINYDRWYFDLFAYSSYAPDFNDIGWLCDWQSADWPEVELTGTKAAQEAFAWYHDEKIWEAQPDLKQVYDASMLLVMAKFAEFIGSALDSGKLLKPIPVLVTAHGFESVARYVP